MGGVRSMFALGGRGAGETWVRLDPWSQAVIVSIMAALTTVLVVWLGLAGTIAEPVPALSLVAALAMVVAVLATATRSGRAGHARSTMEQVFAHSSSGLMVLDADGRVCGWNPAMEALTGYPAAAVQGFPVSMLAPGLCGVPSMTGPHSLEVSFSTRGGTRRDVVASLAPMGEGRCADTRDVPAWVVVVHEALAGREAGQSRDDVVATVSHELRTPLTVIRGFIETMRRDEVETTPQQEAAYLSIMSEQACRLERLINDLLDASAIESGRPLRVQPEDLDMAAELRRAVGAFAIARPDADVHLEVMTEPVLALADAERVQQVVTNLLENAHKHGGRDQRIDVVLEQDLHHALVRVRDHGAGIAPADLERVFDRHYVTTSSVTRFGGGAGLGLYICRRLADAMGGSITVASAEGEGATFTLLLPLVVASGGSERVDVDDDVVRQVLARGDGAHGGDGAVHPRVAQD